MSERNKRNLTQEEVNEILSLKTEDLGRTKLKELFGTTLKKPARFLTNDTFMLPKDKLYNSEVIQTTVGRYVYNLLVLMPSIIKQIGYVNYPLTKGAIEKLESEISSLLLTDKITVQDMIDYIDKSQWLGYMLTLFLSSTIDLKLLEPLPEMNKLKKELSKKYEKEIKKNDPVTSTVIENQLVKLAQEKLKDESSYELYASGAAKNLSSFKNMAIMRGAILDNDSEGKFTVTTDNFMDGISKENYYYFADIAVQASYGRAIETQQGGYIAKQLSAAFQTVTLGPKNSDCGTKKTIKIELNNSNSKEFMYRFVSSGGKLVCLEPSTMKEYIGKTVDLRTPMFCLNDKLCNKCIGDLFYRLGIENVGITANRIGNAIMGLSLKKFHDLSIRYKRFEINKFIK
jgi:hypothetical protein